DARAVDVDAQRADRLGGVQGLAHRIGIGHVGLDELGAIAEFFDRVLTPEVDDDHRRAPVQQPLRRGQTETGSSPGDDGYGAFDLHLMRSSLFFLTSRSKVPHFTTCRGTFASALACGPSSREKEPFYSHSRRTDSMSDPGSPNGFGVGGTVRENCGAGDGSNTSPSR